ncbi:hypothetical protein EV2_006595 [Malus domestica]
MFKLFRSSCHKRALIIPDNTPNSPLFELFIPCTININLEEGSRRMRPAKMQLCMSPGSLGGGKSHTVKFLPPTKTSGSEKIRWSHYIVPEMVVPCIPNSPHDHQTNLKI